MKLLKLVLRDTISRFWSFLLVLTVVSTILLILILLVTNILLDYNHSVLKTALWTFGIIFSAWMLFEVYGGYLLHRLCTYWGELWEVDPENMFLIIKMHDHDTDKVEELGKEECLKKLQLSLLLSSS